MDEKRKEEEILELTADEIDELVFEEQLANGEYGEGSSRILFLQSRLVCQDRTSSR